MKIRLNCVFPNVQAEKGVNTMNDEALKKACAIFMESEVAYLEAACVKECHEFSKSFEEKMSALINEIDATKNKNTSSRRIITALIVALLALGALGMGIKVIRMPVVKFIRELFGVSSSIGIVCNADSAENTHEQSEKISFRYASPFM